MDTDCKFKMAVGIDTAISLQKCGVDVKAVDIKRCTVWCTAEEKNKTLISLLPVEMRGRIRTDLVNFSGYPVSLEGVVSTFADLIKHAERFFIPFADVAITLPTSHCFPTIFVFESGSNHSV